MASGRIKGITIEIDGDTTKLTTSLKQVYKQIRDTASTVFGGIKDFISNTWETIKTMAGTVWEAIKGGLSSAWKGIKTTAGMTFNTIKTKTNEGEIPQFYVKEYHPAIIDPETFDLLQAEVVRRSRTGKRYSAVSVFSSKVVCGDCGGFYGPKVWHSNDRYRREVWRCNQKYNEHGHAGHRCSTPTVAEEEIKAALPDDQAVKRPGQSANRV